MFLFLIFILLDNGVSIVFIDFNLVILYELVYLNVLLILNLVVIILIVELGIISFIL